MFHMKRYPAPRVRIKIIYYHYQNMEEVPSYINYVLLTAKKASWQNLTN